MSLPPSNFGIMKLVIPYFSASSVEFFIPVASLSKIMTTLVYKSFKKGIKGILVIHSDCPQIAVTPFIFDIKHIASLTDEQIATVPLQSPSNK